MKNKLLTICLKTHPNEDDMQSYCDGNLEPCDVRIIYKDQKCWVGKYYDKDYFKLIEETKK